MDEVKKWLIDGFGMALWGGVFVGLLFKVVQKYIDGYISERGKNLATKQDFDEILDRIKESTKIAESIKAEIGSNAWLRQQHWSSQDKHYTAVLGNLAELHSATMNAVTLVKLIDEHRDNKGAAEQLKKDLREQLSKSTNAIESLRIKFASACIYFSDDAKKAVEDIIYREMHISLDVREMTLAADMLAKRIAKAISDVQGSAVQELKELKLLK